MIKLLLARREDELGSAVHTRQYAILKFRHGTVLNEKGEADANRFACWMLFDFPATLLPVPFAGERLLHPFLFTRLQIEGMPFDFFNDVFLLHLPLEAPERVLQSFTFLEPDFRQSNYTS